MQIFNDDCLEILPTMPANSIDMVMADPPYGTTRCKWDSVIPLDLMWEQIKRVVKPNAAIVLTASQPFTTVLIGSNIKMFRYEWIWEKDVATGHLNAKKMPMKCHEQVCVFYSKLPVYNPQFRKGKPVSRKIRRQCSNNYGTQFEGHVLYENNGEQYYPRDIIRFNNGSFGGKQHPTQKPVPLMEYLIKTYTNEGDTVLDFCMGSGTTGVAAINLKRDFVGIEKDVEHGYFDIARDRINQAIELSGCSSASPTYFLPPPQSSGSSDEEKQLTLWD